MTQTTTTSNQAGNARSQHAGNGLAVAGLVCGLVGVLLVNYILGPLAIIFGGVGLSRAKRGAGHRGMSLAAIVLGVIDLIVYAILIIAVTNN